LAHTVAWLQKQKWDVLQHPPNSPDLVPSDFYLCRPFKNLSGKRFEDQTPLKKKKLTSVGREHYHEGAIKHVK
jgi:hypothetical protein